MTNALPQPSRSGLTPVERVSEILFGLILVLTFTGSLSVAEAGRDDVRAMLIGALGCNLAWGIIDALLYLMGCLAEKEQNRKAYLAVRSAGDAAEAQRAISDAVPPVLASILRPDEFAAIHERLKQLPDPPPRARLGQGDWRGAAGVFLLVVVCTFPVAIPFLVMHSAHPAMRVSNAIAVTMLFLAGIAFGRAAGWHPLLGGIVMVVIGLVLVGMTIALGG